jgi:hypothetical protein
LKKEISSKPPVAKEESAEVAQEAPRVEETSAPPPGGMPSMQQPLSADEKEVVLDRVDDEVFPEADELIDDFFSEGGEEAIGFTADEEEPVAEAETVPQEPAAEGEEEEIVEFNLTRVTEEEAAKEAESDEEFRSKIEAELSERLDFGEEAVVETAESAVTLDLEEAAAEGAPAIQAVTEEQAAGVVPSNLDAIIDSFASQLAATLAEEIKKRVQDEVNQLRASLSEEKNDSV